MADDNRKEQIEMLKAMLKGAKDDPKGAAIFFRDVVKDAREKRRNDPKRQEQREMLKAMIQGAKEDPKGAAIFFRDIVKDSIAKRRGR